MNSYEPVSAQTLWSSSRFTGTHNIQPLSWTRTNFSQVRYLKFSIYLFFCTSLFMLCNCSSSVYIYMSVCVCVCMFPLPSIFGSKWFPAARAYFQWWNGDTIRLSTFCSLPKPRSLTRNPFNMLLDRIMTLFRQIILHFSRVWRPFS